MNYNDHISSPTGQTLPVSLDEFHYAERQFKIIMDSIGKFEYALTDDQEVALKLTSFGQDILLNVTGIDYYNPDILRFYGFAGGKPATLVQHVSQLNFLITPAPKLELEKPARRIGFTLEPHKD